MQRFDTIFAKIASKLSLTGEYNADKLNFDCLRKVMDASESRCGRLSDYGLIYVKYFAQACEAYAPESIISSIEC